MKALFACFLSLVTAVGVVGQTYTNDKLATTRLDAGQHVKDRLGKAFDSSAALHVITFLDPECPISQKYTNPLNRMAGNYRAQNVVFYGIMSVQNIGQTQIDSFVSHYEIQFPCLADQKLKTAKALGATVTPEVFVLDRNLDIVYSGAIDDWFFKLGQSKKRATNLFLKEAVESYLRQRPVKMSRTEPVGCRISFTMLKEHK